MGEVSKVQERRMRWYGHVMRGDEEYVGKSVMVGLRERRSEREGTVRRGGVRPSCMEATIVPCRPHIELG